MGFNNTGFISPESVSAVTTTPQVTLGTRTVINGNEYVYVYNCGNAAIKVGWGGYVTANSGYSVSVSNAASQVGFLAGVCHHASIPTAYYGWLMTKGVCYVAADGSETSAASGNYIFLGVDGGFVAAAGTASLATGVRYGWLISTLQTQGTTTPGKAWIKSDWA